MTDLLLVAQRGGPGSWETALPAVYQDLRRIAATHLCREAPGHILQPTALVHEVWLKVARSSGLEYESRNHFFSICSRMMRQILVDEARRGTANDLRLSAISGDVDRAALEDALQELEKLNPRQCRVVEMRYFGGMSIEEISAVLDASPRTIKRDWAAARAWLFEHLQA